MVPRPKPINRKRLTARQSLDEMNLDYSTHANDDVTTKAGNVYQKMQKLHPSLPPLPAPPQTGEDSASPRRRSFIAQRISDNGKQKGPWCLFSGASGCSLAVTRSLGDSDAARCCISEPEIIRRKIPAGTAERIVICSDGVWDVMTSADVAERARSGSNPAAAAKKVALIAKERRSRGFFGRDDITVMVVDVGEFGGGGGEGKCNCVIS